MTKLEEVEGIGAAYAEKLKGAGIDSVEGLLTAGATPAGRAAIVEQTGFTNGQVLEWVNHADLMRIKGVGSEYADLLEASGVDTVRELAQRRPDNLTAKMAEVNEAKKLVRRLPVQSEVERWVAEAKTLPPAITY